MKTLDKILLPKGYKYSVYNRYECGTKLKSEYYYNDETQYCISVFRVAKSRHIITIFTNWHTDTYLYTDWKDVKMCGNPLVYDVGFKDVQKFIENPIDYIADIKLKNERKPLVVSDGLPF